MQEVGYYLEEDDDTFDRHLTAKISDLIYDEENPDHTQMSQNSTHMSQESTQMSQESTQMSQEETDRSHAGNVILKHAVEKPKHTLSFTTDNARDISKAIKGKYQWLGCSAHHINLVVKQGFKTNKTAAHLLKKCKKIVSTINYSNPIIYDVRKYQHK